MFGLGQQFIGDLRVPSGMAEATGVMGRVRFEMPAGTGKRTFKSRQFDRNLCEWTSAFGPSRAGRQT